MGVNSRLLLEFRSSGYNNGQVFLHLGSEAINIYYGPAAQTIYEALKRFAQQQRNGSGDFYEQKTSAGAQWREKL